MEAVPHHPVDGSARGWVTVFGGFWGLFITFGWINSLGIFQTYYETTLLRTYSPSTIAWIASVQQCLMYSGGIVFGKLFDSYGPRQLVIFGSAAHVFGLMMTSISTQYYQIFLAQAICSAAGCSAVFYASFNAVATFFKKKRATATGITASGSSLGGVIFPIAVNQLIPKIGFGWTMRVVAFIVLFGGVLASLTIVSNVTHTPTPFSLRDYTKPLRDLKFAVMIASLTIFGFGLFLPFNFLVSSAVHGGMSLRLAIYTIAILNGASTVGRLLPGILADRYGRLNVTVLFTGVSGIISLALWLPGHGNAATISYGALFGFFSGGYVSLTPALSAQLSPQKETGLWMGTLYFFISFGVLAGSPIGGALIGKDNGGFVYLQVFAGSVMCGGSALLLALRLSLQRISQTVEKSQVSQRTSSILDPEERTEVIEPGTKIQLEGL